MRNNIFALSAIMKKQVDDKIYVLQIYNAYQSKSSNPRIDLNILHPLEFACTKTIMGLGYFVHKYMYDVNLFLSILEEELGAGAFAVVYFAHAVGMAKFLRRRSVLKDNKPQRRFSFTLFKKRNPSLSINDCDIVKTAVKTLKGNQNSNNNITIYIFQKKYRRIY
jgi:hypothetical protein